MISSRAQGARGRPDGTARSASLWPLWHKMFGPCPLDFRWLRSFSRAGARLLKQRSLVSTRQQRACLSQKTCKLGGLAALSVSHRLARALFAPAHGCHSPRAAHELRRWTRLVFLVDSFNVYLRVLMTTDTVRNLSAPSSFWLTVSQRIRVYMTAETFRTSQLFEDSAAKYYKDCIEINLFKTFCAHRGTLVRASIVREPRAGVSRG